MKHFGIIILSLIIFSCSWVSDTWEKRPDWAFPEDKQAENIDFKSYNLVSGFNSKITGGKLEKKLDEKNIKFSSSRDSRKDLKIYSVDGSLLDTKNSFSYKNIESNVDFFDGDFLSSRIFIDALNSTNLDQIVSALYNFLVDNYSEPTSESSIYSFETYIWKQGDLEVFLSIDPENNSVVLSEINSALEESRRFKEFKEKYIEEFQTYEEELRYGKNRR